MKFALHTWQSQCMAFTWYWNRGLKNCFIARTQWSLHFRPKQSQSIHVVLEQRSKKNCFVGRTQGSLHFIPGRVGVFTSSPAYPLSTLFSLHPMIFVSSCRTCLNNFFSKFELYIRVFSVFSLQITASRQ